MSKERKEIMRMTSHQIETINKEVEFIKQSQSQV